MSARRQRVPMNPREGRSRMWQGMRVMRTFTVADLEATAEVCRASALHYVQALREAGYLQCVDGKPAGRFVRGASYRLLRDTGPHGPRVSRSGAVLDINLEPAPKVATVTIPKSEYQRALRCIGLVQNLRANAPTDSLRRAATAALEVAR